MLGQTEAGAAPERVSGAIKTFFKAFAFT